MVRGIRRAKRSKARGHPKNGGALGNLPGWVSLPGSLRPSKRTLIGKPNYELPCQANPIFVWEHVWEGLLAGSVSAAPADPVDAAIDALQVALQRAANTPEQLEAKWKSMHTSRAGWKFKDVSDMAVFWLKSLPQDALGLLLSGALKPGPLIEHTDEKTENE